MSIDHVAESIKVIEWHGLYSDSWQGEIVPEAFSHPAKYSRAMIRQIYRHMVDSGYVHPGDHIVDPFGGVGLGALDAMRHGLHWHGCELEPRFVELGNQNLGLWQARYSGGYAAWGTGDFVRNKKRVMFGQQWLELCAAVGFEPVEWIVCWKTEYHGSQLDIFGDTHHKQIDRVSFFRQLANQKNPGAAILNEDIIIMRKPL